MITKPMLSATVHAHELDKIRWPALCSPKLDGIRCIIHPELGPVTRSFKPVPNEYIRTSLVDLIGPVPFDGELVAVNEGDEPLSFNETQSAVMSRDGRPRFVYCVFDYMQYPEHLFGIRLADAKAMIELVGNRMVNFVPHTLVESSEHFMEVAEQYVAAGYEGTMLRDPAGPYKNGRSTLNQGWLVKYKEWADAEGTIIGFEERMHNSNEDIKDEFGYAKRSSHKAGMVGMGTLGALILNTKWGELRVGSGLDDALRQDIWNRNIVKPGPENILMGMKQPDFGRKVTFKYQAFGMQDKPRFPIFLHFREQE